MAEKCILCGAPLGSLQATKTAEGSICKACTANIPASLHIRAMSRSALLRVSEYEKELKARDYDITASYGKLLVDEMSGYLFLAEKVDNDDNPVGVFEMYDLSDVKEIGLYPVKPRADKGNILCDVEFNMTLESPPVKIKKIVKAGARCTYKYVKGSSTKVEWEEPGDLSLFRNMLVQAAQAATERVVKKKVPSLTKHGLEVLQAESALYLKEGYTLQEAEDHAGKIINGFMTDPEEAKEYIGAIRYYLEVVKQEIKRKEIEGSDIR